MRSLLTDSTKSVKRSDSNKQFVHESDTSIFLPYREKKVKDGLNEMKVITCLENFSLCVNSPFKEVFFPHNLKLPADPPSVSTLESYA